MVVINPLIPSSPHARPGDKAADLAPATQLIRTQFSSQRNPRSYYQNGERGMLSFPESFRAAPRGCRCLCSITALVEVRFCHHRTMCHHSVEANSVSVPLFLILRAGANKTYRKPYLMYGRDLGNAYRSVRCESDERSKEPLVNDY